LVFLFLKLRILVGWMHEEKERPDPLTPLFGDIACASIREDTIPSRGHVLS
jgi:hypothetical protein